jgi:hypothetical protein
MYLLFESGDKPQQPKKQTPLRRLNARELLLKKAAVISTN